MKKPMIFIFSLIVLVVFLFGVRLGTQVDKQDKELSSLLTPSPTNIPSPTNTPISYIEYKLENCNVSFSLSNLFSQSELSSEEAKFNHGNQKVYINCNPEIVAGYKKLFATKEPELTENVNNQKINMYKTDEGIGYIIKKQSSKETLFSFPESLLPLFKSSI